MNKSKLIAIKESNITLKNCPPNAKIKVYYEVIEEQDDSMRHVKKDKMTLTKLATIVSDLAKEMREGFKQVNKRIDKIDMRLDYIVKANNLKDLPKNR